MHLILAVALSLLSDPGRLAHDSLPDPARPTWLVHDSLPDPARPARLVHDSLPDPARPARLVHDSLPDPARPARLVHDSLPDPVLQASAPEARQVARDESAIRDVVKEYVAARERADTPALAALFADGADQLTSSGEWRRGRDEVVRGTLESSKRTSGTRTITLETIRFPAAGVAVADGRYEIAGGQDGTRRMWTMFLLVRTADRWRIAAIRNMLPAAPAAPAVK